MKIALVAVAIVIFVFGMLVILGNTTASSTRDPAWAIKGAGHLLVAAAVMAWALGAHAVAIVCGSVALLDYIVVTPMMGRRTARGIAPNRGRIRGQ